MISDSFQNLSGTSDFYYQQRYNNFDSQDAPTIYDELKKASVVANNNPDDSKQTNNIDFTLAILGIEHLKNSPLIQLSSGEHKRFQLAKALMNPPDELILDTPYTGLDVSGVNELNNILLKISKQGAQIIIIPGTFETPDYNACRCSSKWPNSLFWKQRRFGMGIKLKAPKIVTVIILICCLFLICLRNLSRL